MKAVLDDLRFPIGKFQPTEVVTPEQRAALIARIERMPTALRAALAGLSAEQLDTPYREGGWTLRQVAHHLPDSHQNGYTRFKLALTEAEPTIKPYDEAGWAELPDTAHTPLDVSLALLEALHQRWVILLRSLTEEQWARSYQHPESGTHRLDRSLGLYAWHGDHHVGHVTALRRRMGW